jgi:hypothetical protein
LIRERETKYIDIFSPLLCIMMEEEVESISQRRVRLYQKRQGAAGVISSILTTIGAVEAISEGTRIFGILTVIFGLVLEKERKDPSRLTSLVSLAIVSPPVFSTIFNGSYYKKTSTEAFLLALKCCCILMLLRLLFMGRRLRQLGEVQKPAKDL